MIRKKYFTAVIFFVLVLLVLGLMVFSLYKQGVFLQPNVGAQTVDFVKSFSTNQVATITSADLGQTVYAFDGASGFSADLFGDDGQEEFFYYNGDRFGVLGPNNENLLYIDGRGNALWRDGAAIVVRVDDGTSNEEKYIVVKSSSQDCAENWCSHKEVAVYALNNFNGYSAGQKIVSLPFLGVIFWLNMGEVVLRVNEPLFVTASNRDFEEIEVYKLELSSAGLVSLTSAGFVENPVYPALQPACFGGESTSGAGPHRGNAMNQVKLCRTDFNGLCTGVYENYLLNNEFFRINTDGGLIKVGSWYDYNGVVIPVAQGGDWTVCFPYGATFSHVDSSHVFNAGTETSPDYRLIIMWDGEGARTVSARISVDAQGTFTLIPMWATVGGSSAGGTSQQLALGNVKGLSNGYYIVNGRYVFDSLTGQILADTNLLASGNGFSFSDAKFWPRTTQESYVVDRHYGFESQPYQSTNILAQVLPFIQSYSFPNSGTSFGGVGSGLPSGSAHTGNENQGGFLRNIGLVSDYDLQTDSLSFKLIKFRNQQHASLLRLNNEVPYITGVTQEHKDVFLKFVQQPRIAGHRGFDMFNFMKDLENLAAPPPTCSGTGSCLTAGVCTGTLPVCLNGAWACNYPSTYQQTETLCDGLDNDCDGPIDEGGVCSAINYYCDDDIDSYFDEFIDGTCSAFQCAPLICSLVQGNDCDDANSGINPGAVEICNDNLDNDCDGDVDCDDFDCFSNLICSSGAPSGLTVTLQ